MMLGLRNRHQLPATKSSSTNIRSNYDYVFKNHHSEKDDIGTNLRPSNWSNNLISLAIVLALITPLPSSAIHAFGSKSLSLPSAAIPFLKAKNLPTGLEDGCVAGSNMKRVHVIIAAFLFLYVIFLFLWKGDGAMT